MTAIARNLPDYAVVIASIKLLQDLIYFLYIAIGLGSTDNHSHGYLNCPEILWRSRRKSQCVLNKGFAAVCLAASPQPIKLLKRFTSHYGSNSLDGNTMARDRVFWNQPFFLLICSCFNAIGTTEL